MSQTYTVVNYTNLANLTSATGSSAASAGFALKSSHSVLRIATETTAGATGVYFTVASQNAATTATAANPIASGETFVNVPGRSANISTAGADTGSGDFQIIFDLPNDHAHPFKQGDYISISGTSVSGYNTHFAEVDNDVNSSCIVVGTTGGALAQATGGTVRLAYRMAVLAVTAATKLTVTEVTPGN